LPRKREGNCIGLDFTNKSVREGVLTNKKKKKKKKKQQKKKKNKKKKKKKKNQRKRKKNKKKQKKRKSTGNSFLSTDIFKKPFHMDKKE